MPNRKMGMQDLSIQRDMLRYKPKLYGQCNICGKITTEFPNIVNRRYARVCTNCLMSGNNTFEICKACGNWKVKGMPCSCQRDESRSLRAGSESWQDRKIPDFIGHDSRYYGLEIEIELPRNQEDLETLNEIVEKENYIYTKHDGSLYNGVEIVTEPISANELINRKSNIKVQLSKFLKNLKYNGASAEGTYTCGLHIHVNNEVFNTFHLYKIYKFLNDNKDWIINFARRDQESVDRFARISYGSYRTAIQVIKTKLSNRHSALNIMNTNTIEFRFFKGTLNPYIFFRNIQFIDSLIDFSRQTSLSNITLNNYIQYINKLSKNYMELQTYVRNYI